MIGFLNISDNSKQIKRPSENATPAKPKLRFLPHGTNVFRRPQIPFCRRPAFPNTVVRLPIHITTMPSEKNLSFQTASEREIRIRSLPAKIHCLITTEFQNTLQTTNKRANRQRWCSYALWYAIRPDDIFSYACFGLPQTFSY